MAILIKEISFGEAIDASFMDLPAIGRVAGPALTLAGWFVLPKGSQNIRVEISLRTLDNKWLTEAAVGERADVPVEGDFMACGYEARIHSYDLPSTFTLDVWNAYEHGGLSLGNLIASITGMTVPDAPTRNARLSPVYVMGLARSGTTVLTRMLGAHPAIICGEKYPLELCVSTFHARLARLATASADFAGFLKPHLFSEADLVGPNPFASLNHLDRDALDDIQTAMSGVFLQAAVDANDTWYSRIAEGRSDKQGISLYVEKSQPGRALITALNVYPNARCVVLVRDPRDTFLSKIRFNRKRGTQDFGEKKATDLAHWAYLHVQEYRAHVFDHIAMNDRVAQVIRYEDLMEDPEDTLSATCAALGIDASNSVIGGMIAAGQTLSNDSATHRTLSDENNEPLSDEIQDLLERIARDLSTFFDKYGYVV